MQNKILVALATLSLFFASASYALAVNVPSFPNCANPQGAVVSAYTDGEHGIVGDQSTHIGRDTVYKLSDDTVTQCFCSTSGEGIQTNWWKASSLSQEQTDILKSQGWYYVPNGNLWGLDSAPYVAQNISSSCLPGTTSNSGSNGSSSSSTTASSDPSGSVLGLASTGDSIYLYGSFVLAFFFLILSIKRLAKHN